MRTSNHVERRLLRTSATNIKTPSTLVGTMMTSCSGCRNWNVGGSKISSHVILSCILKDIDGLKVPWYGAQ
ncbi:hypothetical protein FOC4_g10010522 [Fusarium odoratissimum]|uniref:Uncharacterized protein n=2 Tax=Fusarium oxysporum species complex TaxID=171631 RepID=N1REA8_FUSC4|nr:hypothetical protein FOC4_g10010522 [Fusarium odoratissimum]TXC10154.1 hypothetical protein FocTR4_00005576 [Fusarium oxysporum f. sp. cubense]